MPKQITLAKNASPYGTISASNMPKNPGDTAAISAVFSLVILVLAGIEGVLFYAVSICRGMNAAELNFAQTSRI